MHSPSSTSPSSSPSASSGRPISPVFPTVPLRSLAVVLPRYGADLGGGAETLIREIVCHLHQGNFSPEESPLLSGIQRIEVWTTCARDHRTWENFHPPGETREDGFPVRRFPVDERNLEIFIGREMDIAAGRRLHPSEQMDWLGAGVNSRALYAHIAKHGPEFDAILFGPYLFPTTFWGGLIHPDRSILLPCLHNEPYAYQDVFGTLFRSVRGIICNAGAEADLVREVYGAGDMEAKTAVVGMGFEMPTEASPEVVPSEKSAQPTASGTKGRYLLYSGRKEEGKNLHRLIEWFTPLRAKHPELELVLIGSGEIQFLKELPDGVLDRGFVSEEEKRRLMGSALALCQPSVNESFSIVLMEAWLERTPVLVHGNCPVTKEHAVKSQGGLYFTNAPEFAAVVERLLASSDFAKTLGDNGYRYVTQEYSWTAVLSRLEQAFSQFGYESSVRIVDAQANQ